MNTIIRNIVGPQGTSVRSAAYRTVWRWHFYAGLFCLPFVLVLSLSGAVYLFKPQLDAWLDRPYDHLALAGAPQSLDAQVAAAQAALPDARLTSLELRADPADAARVAFMTGRRDADDFVIQRVLVRPDTLEILAIQDDKYRPSQLAGGIHGTLLLGTPGHVLLELVGAWAIVMIVSGLYLWWPRDAKGLAGVAYPRLSEGGRMFWRDLHAVTGLWVSFFALFLLITALPWTLVWGESFRFARNIGEKVLVHSDWTTGPADEREQRKAQFQQAAPAASEHAEHQHHMTAAAAPTHAGFDRIAPIAAGLGLAEPVLIAPPGSASPNWNVQSKTQNRPLRRSIDFDPESLRQVGETGFATSPLVERIVGVGVAAHEGQLFGWPNQLLGLLSVIGYLLLVVSSVALWWRRRPRGALGAPPAFAPEPRLAPFVVGLVVALGLLLPTLGLSLLAVLAAEQIIRRASPGASRWLGLRPIEERAAARQS
ncbi:MAG TPA: PepSY domain-containing protein [Methylosinus sp.]|jgi:uncharacterized iron-regulated membrane protein|uniref:PepSY-associated TM helix domain-containing protein n=1 Tax=Methylosinus sp. TaxID=427 RepID=UPI002F920240